jgi:hypothetical protein
MPPSSGGQKSGLRDGISVHLYPYFSTLKTEAAGFAETSVPFKQTT